MLKLGFTSFGNDGFTSDEADVVAINDDRHASLARFRRLTSLDLSENNNLDPTLMMAKLNESTNGGYVNEAMVITEEAPSDVKLPIEDTPRYPQVAVDVRDLTFTYGFGKKSLLTLKKINVSVPQGKIYALLGSSGCGKYFYEDIIL